MAKSHRRFAMIFGLVSSMAIGFAVLPPIAQDPRYHTFADSRTLHGVPNFWNVISNVPFLVVALYGIRSLPSRAVFVERWEQMAFSALLAGTFAVGVGSTYYHLHLRSGRWLSARSPGWRWV
jgi:hypothetical protein